MSNLFSERIIAAWNGLSEDYILDLLHVLKIAFQLLILQPERQHWPKIMKPPQSLALQMAERLLRAQPDSVANQVTDRLISDRRALT